MGPLDPLFRISAIVRIRAEPGSAKKKQNASMFLVQIKNKANKQYKVQNLNSAILVDLGSGG